MDPNRWEERARAREERHRQRMERWRNHSNYRHHHAASMIWGVIIIAVGVLFLLRNLNILYFDSIWEFWPVILIAVGVSKMTSSSHPANVLPGVIIAGIGALFLLQNLGFIYGSFWQYLWPGILIAVGLSMLAKHLDWGLSPPEGAGQAQPGDPVSSGAPASGSPANRLHIEVVFGGDRRRLISQDFEGGKIAAVFGGVEVDLRDVATTRREVVLHADAVFGGIELRVPEAWNIDVRGAGVFGGYLDKTHRSHHPPEVNAPRLVVKGGAVFGSVIVRN